ncbi:MAG: DUF364 domain-containing protein [Candidatus Eisenbacteria bacterium]
MALLEDLIESVRQKDMEVREIVAGSSWTMVATAGWGIAAGPGGADALDGLCGKPAGELLELASRPRPVRASVGIATLNSLIIGQVDSRHFKPYKIPTAKDKKIVVVGDFHFTDHLKTIALDVCVVEKNRETGDYAGNEQAFRDADVALISGATMVDGTLESLLKLAGPCYTIVYGPSTPLSPVLFEYGADQLVGVRVKDEIAAKRCITEGMGDLSGCPGLAPVVMEAGQKATD